jgi:hypothetical protein
MPSFARKASLILLSFACAIGSAAAMAASDVADAAMRQDYPGVERLISAKSDVNAAQADGTTALRWAAYHGDVKVAGLKRRSARGRSPPRWHGVHIAGIRRTSTSTR